jgi:hypothetical protein
MCLVAIIVAKVSLNLITPVDQHALIGAGTRRNPVSNSLFAITF